MFIDSASVAIMTRINDLISRHGLQPTECVATLDSDEQGRRVLCFVAPPVQPTEHMRFRRMLDDLGIPAGETLTIRETDGELCARVDGALARAPRMRR